MTTCLEPSIPHTTSWKHEQAEHKQGCYSVQYFAFTINEKKISRMFPLKRKNLRAVVQKTNRNQQTKPIKIPYYEEKSNS